MNKSLPTVSISLPVGPLVNPEVECKKPAKDEPLFAKRQKLACFRTSQSGKLYSRFAGYLAFCAAALAAMIAAVTVASHDVPLMLGGF